MKKKLFTLTLAALMAAISIVPPAPVTVQATDTDLMEQPNAPTGSTDNPIDDQTFGQTDDPTDNPISAQQTGAQEELPDIGPEDPAWEHADQQNPEESKGQSEDLTAGSADDQPQEQTAGEPRAQADLTYTGQYWKIEYTEKSDGSLEITDAYSIYSNADPLVIPEEIDGKPVTSIRSFQGAPIENIELPDSITSIGKNAFYQCSALTSVRLPAHLTQIERNTFAECTALSNVNIPDSVTSIDHYAFFKCSSLTDINLPEGLLSVGSSAFYECSRLSKLTLPESLTDIGWHAFAGCSGLKKIFFPRALSTLSKGIFSDCTGLTSITIPDTVTILEENAFGGCTGLKEISFPAHLSDQIEAAFGLVYETAADGGLTLKKSRSEILPTTINGKKITRIGNLAFYNTDIKTAVIPEGVTVIDHQAFQNCFFLENIQLPRSLKTLGERVFKDCTRLTSISIPEGVTVIGPWAFSRCLQLDPINLPKSVTTIREGGFHCCRVLKDITIPQNVKILEKDTFEDCAELAKITLPAGLTTIEDNAFPNCSKLKDVYFQGSRTQWRNINIGTGNTSLTSATIHYAVSDGTSDTCKVTFDTAGIGTAIPAQNIKEGGLATRPTTVPTRNGYTFDGWYQGDKRWDFNSDKITRDTTLTARWNDEEATYISGGRLYESNFNHGYDRRRIIPVGATITIGHSSLYDDVVFHHASWDFQNENILKPVDKNNSQCKALARAVGTTSVTITTKFQGILPGTPGLFLDQDDITVEHFRVADYLSSLALPSSMSLKTGQSAPINVTTVPAGNYSRAVSGFTLTSSRSDIVDIRSDNIAIGKSKGTATITATAKNKDGAPLKATCTVTVDTAATPTQTPVKPPTPTPTKTPTRIPTPTPTKTPTRVPTPTPTKTPTATPTKVPTKTPTPAPSVCRHSRFNKKIVSVTKKAGYLEDGKRILQCKICGKKTTETVPGYDRVEMYCDGKYYDEQYDNYVCEYEYTGKVIRPTIRVLDRKGKRLKQGTDYTLTYPKNAKAPEYYTMTVTFKGSYHQHYDPHFWIYPNPPQITSLKAEKGGFTLKWKKPAYATGYYIRYSTSPKFTKKTTHTVHVRGGNTRRRTVLKLAKNKKYYIDISCYRKIGNHTSYSYYCSDTWKVRTK